MMSEIEVVDMGDKIVITVTAASHYGVSTATVISLTPRQHKDMIEMMQHPTPYSDHGK